jgi:outer membrane protein assembly factor BamB
VGHFLALDAASGKRLWSKDFSSLIDTSKLFCGTAASPILAYGAVVVQVGSDVRGGQIVALDPATGAERWLWKGDGPGYASPILLGFQGGEHLVTLTNKSIVGLDAQRGSLLWSIPFPDDWHENIVTPVWTGRSWWFRAFGRERGLFDWLAPATRGPRPRPGRTRTSRCT